MNPVNKILGKPTIYHKGMPLTDIEYKMLRKKGYTEEDFDLVF